MGRESRKTGSGGLNPQLWPLGEDSDGRRGPAAPSPPFLSRIMISRWGLSTDFILCVLTAARHSLPSRGPRVLSHAFSFCELCSSR